MVINDVVYYKKEDAGKKLLELTKKIKSLNDEIPIGNYRGFQMTMYYNTIYEDFHLKLSNKLSYSVTLGNDVYGNITRINNVLNGIEDEIYKAKEQLVEMNNQFKIFT